MTAQRIFGQLARQEAVQALIATLGTPYHWARGAPSTPWPPGPCDCSGFAQAALVMLGLLRPDEPDRTAGALAYVCTPIGRSDARLGDLVFYGHPVSHVMVCLGAGWCIGARGGTSKTLGDDPKAFVDIRPVDYRSDVICYGRLDPSLAPH